MAAGSAVIVNVAESPNIPKSGVPGGTSGPAEPWSESETNGSPASASRSGALFPFSAISLTPKLAGAPISNTLVARRCVATTGGVNGWPPVRLVIVMRYWLGFFATAGDANTMVARVAAASTGNQSLFRLFMSLLRNRAGRGRR